MRDIARDIDLDALEPAHVPAVAADIVLALGADDQDRVAGLELRGGSGEIDLGEALPYRQRLRGLRRHRIPFDACRDGRDGFEILRVLIRIGYALHACAEPNRDWLRGERRLAWPRLQRGRARRARGDARRQPVADQPR